MTPKEKDKIEETACKMTYPLAFEKGFNDAVKQTKAKLREDIEKCKTYTRKIKPIFRGQFPKYITLIEKKELLKTLGNKQ